jgi:hypothetical protein
MRPAANNTKIADEINRKLRRSFGSNNIEIKINPKTDNNICGFAETVVSKTAITKLIRLSR